MRGKWEKSEPMQLHVPSEEALLSRSAGSLDDSTAASGSKASNRKYKDETTGNACSTSNTPDIAKSFSMHTILFFLFITVYYEEKEIVGIQ